MTTIRDYGLTLADEFTPEPVTNTDLIEVLEAAHNEISLAVRIARELEYEMVAGQLQALMDSVRDLGTSIPA